MGVCFSAFLFCWKYFSEIVVSVSGGFAVWPFKLQSLLFLRRCILNSLISDRSSANLFLWTNYLFGVLNEMCSSSALSAGNCYFGLRRGWLPSVLHFECPPLWQRQSNLQFNDMKNCFSVQQFMDAVERYCTPVAGISLSSILISFPTVLISNCSASLCPLYPSAISFEKGKHALNTH